MNSNTGENMIKVCPIIGSPICKCSSESETPIISLGAGAEPNIKSLLRKLFTDHAVYTKFYIESVLHDLPDSQSISVHLMANQEEIGMNVGYFVGNEKGVKLSDLLKQHIVAAGTAVVAAKNNKNLTEAKQKLFNNSRDVAKFLSDLNPVKIPFSVMKEQFDQHNNFVLKMVVLHLAKKYSEEIKIYDQYYNHMMMMSDLLCVALIEHLATTIISNQKSTNEYSDSNASMNVFCLVLALLLIVIIVYRLRCVE